MVKVQGCNNRMKAQAADFDLVSFRVLSERAVQEMRRQGVSFSSLQSSLPLSVSTSSQHISPERSILRSLNRSTDKSADR